MAGTAKRRLLGLISIACWLCTGCPGREPRAAAGDAPLAYLELTTQGASVTSKLPLLIVLHGLGETPERIARVFADVEPATRIIAARAPDPWGDGGSWYPIEKTPRKTRKIYENAQRVVQLISYVKQQRPTAGKAVVTGFSQGGVLSFALAAYHADHIFGAVPIAGFLPLDAPVPRKPPAGFRLLVFHGRDDTRIPFSDAERTVSWLRAAGFDASLRGYAGVGHGISSEMRRDLHEALRTLLRAASR